jgi:hypothetical protein
VENSRDNVPCGIRSGLWVTHAALEVAAGASRIPNRALVHRTASGDAARDSCAATASGPRPWYIRHSSHHNPAYRGAVADAGERREVQDAAPLAASSS